MNIHANLCFARSYNNALFSVLCRRGCRFNLEEYYTQLQVLYMQNHSHDANTYFMHI